MYRLRSGLTLALYVLLYNVSVMAQSPQNQAMNAPDEVAWQLFVQVNAPAAGGVSTFETWASDADTFKPSPQFPATATPLSLHPPALVTAARAAAQAHGHLLPAIPPIAGGANEESRHNEAAFNFIRDNDLYRVSGLRAAFGKVLSFPVDSMEVKGNWVLSSAIPQFTKNRVSAADVPKLYHINTGSDGKQYALVAVHVISKLVPNWTWATFEHQYNPGRCDILGCKDRFGAQTAEVKPNPQPDAGYPACDKVPALSAMMSQAKLDAVFANYCLKGSQTDFTDDTGLAIRVGNSVTESGFVPTSSCITCHSRAAWDKTGKATSVAGFIDPDNGIAPLGPPSPAWNWKSDGTAKPPFFQGQPGLTQIATTADFVWSVPFCAMDDTRSPPTLKCRSK